MLELQEVSLQLGDSAEDPMLLAEVSVRFPRRHFAAILGPSGCGKSTLLKIIAGLSEQTQGAVRWDGRDLSEDDMDPHEIGYVPQFSIAYELLTVMENLESALRLRVGGLSSQQREHRLDQILREVGLEEIADRQVRVLSGGQKRRLALALEMLSDPHLLLCDEVTSGLDPKSEDEIARLIHGIAHRENRIVLSVTHSLRHLALYDSVLVLHQGRLAYHGPAQYLFHYFGVENHEDLFPRLAERSAEQWHQSWVKRRESYYESAGLLAGGKKEAAKATEPDVAPISNGTHSSGEANSAQTQEESAATAVTVDSTRDSGPPDSKKEPKREKEGDSPADGETEILLGTPSAITQFFVLLFRRWKIFFRDRGNIALQIALMAGFPILVVVFALDGLPQIKSLDSTGPRSAVEQIVSMSNEFARRQELVHTGSLVSGLIMFQVILLALMGSNNAAREIAGERLIFEKEKFAGVRPTAYVASKAAFLGVLVLAQSVWMGVFVNLIVQFRGNLGTQIMLLLLVNAALTFVCLAISSLMKTAEQASLVSIYLVGFQLPLSGAVLALPKVLSWIAQPFIASYWGWSGFIQTMHDTRFYEAVLAVTQTKLAPDQLCAWVLCSHVVIALLITCLGCRNSRWE